MFFPETRPQVEVLEEIETIVQDVDLWSLVIFNDEVNTFDYVIDTLVEICDHTAEQAEQCAVIIHFKGKCAVKNGEYDNLVSMRNEICRRGISAEIMLK